MQLTAEQLKVLCTFFYFWLTKPDTFASCQQMKGAAHELAKIASIMVVCGMNGIQQGTLRQALVSHQSACSVLQALLRHGSHSMKGKSSFLPYFA